MGPQPESFKGWKAKNADRYSDKRKFVTDYVISVASGTQTKGAVDRAIEVWEEINEKVGD